MSSVKVSANVMIANFELRPHMHWHCDDSQSCGLGPAVRPWGQVLVQGTEAHNRGRGLEDRRSTSSGGQDIELVLNTDR